MSKYFFNIAKMKVKIKTSQLFKKNYNSLDEKN